ncbi:helix-turn-helix transcriptional regulator [Deinococcus fonticola]|uniref:helix-turn-helix transcriptional regulator n=1 Tax=Deinococcus fonticola TaxID=2528713 RepID=UPI001075541F|nr:WYL domain-containing transcriptional regulator [Deinococcus fonticola]
MSAPATKAQRVRALLELLARAECSPREITQRLQLPANKLRSVQRDLGELLNEGEIERLHSGKYRVPPRGALFNAVEALAVYSAARMLYHHASEYNEHYLSALEKLTTQLPPPARRVAMLANEAYRKRPNATTSRTFEMVAQAWLQGRVLKCDYQSLSKKTPSKMELVIYFIELGARNRESYAIGVNRLKGGADPFVYRLSRMKNAALLDEECHIPEDFHPLKFLSNAWGVMTGQPTRVELHFTPEVKDRVAETHFTPDAQVRVLNSGHTRVVFTVGGWLELVHWVLGWGGEVEVIEPEELRQAVTQGHQRGAGVYAEVQQGQRRNHP